MATASATRGAPGNADELIWPTRFTSAMPNLEAANEQASISTAPDSPAIVAFFNEMTRIIRWPPFAAGFRRWLGILVSWTDQLGIAVTAPCGSPVTRI